MTAMAVGVIVNPANTRLEAAAENAVKTMAFPTISTGSCGDPKDLAAPLVIDEMTRLLQRGTPIEKVILVCFEPEDFERYQTLLKP